ncbi:hypothetical protein AQUCO_01100375v1 [Aquilegia coerulea]|uniref:DNA-directed DNA polymerase n=1 Tax=Aquilegia coerulea TaxID=218851 RepID=A0A2G5E6W6_AQUCA|nr:hypothetical protein AQUCO_01100375v1 [Aquilegia coerulea]
MKEMMDGRRHSVDVPLSRTLVALRRVRSLRDPSTNSMSKFSYVDNLTWETDSCNGISLGLANGFKGGGLDNHTPPRSQKQVLKKRRDGSVSDSELDSNSRRHCSKAISSKKFARVRKRALSSAKTKWTDESGYSRSRRDLINDNTLVAGRHGNDHIDKALELARISHSSNHLGDVELFGETPLSTRSQKNEPTENNQKSVHSRRIKALRENGDSGGSCLGSPYPCGSNGMDGSSHNTSLFVNENLDIMDYNDRGCGISCCWSSTPRFRESNLPSEVEDQPLLSIEGGEMNLSEPERRCTYAKNELAPYSDSPRSLSHKFRPRSFDELVGQNVVTRSLLNAISKGKISSFYLFHGPRGTGKTSASRIFAAALNCLSLEEHRPCQLCRECRLFLSRRSRDIKEVDSSKINKVDRMRSLLKSAVRRPMSSRYKVFIIDECQLLEGDTWSTLLNSFDDLPRHVVFVMITADLDSLPRSAVSRCQRYHFPKIKDADVVNRLANICVEEGLEFEKVALNFIAAKSNGSLRDAEIILDQLSLLGRKITISLAHELIGVVSDEELLDLLDVALSSDTSSTVVRARELMKSRVDPMQLISQLANLIMDILAGRFETGISEVQRHFFGTNTSEADLQKLRNALKILSETEKQLRTSKNQTTWLTAALLQLSSVDSSPLDTIDSRACIRNHQRDDRFCSTSSLGENVKHSSSCLCCDNKFQNLQTQRDTNGKLENIWRGAVERCQSSTLKKFLQKEGRLSSISVNKGVAVAEVEFYQADHVARAEKSWEVIASSLQLVLGCNVEIRINLVPCASVRKSSTTKKPSFSLLSCSRRMPLTTEEDNTTDNSDFASERPIMKEKRMETYSSDNGSQFSSIRSQHNELATAIRNSEGNALGLPHESAKDVPTIGSQLKIHSSKLDNVARENQLLAIQEPENQTSCFPKKVKFQKRLCSAVDSERICFRIRSHNKLELSIPQEQPIETFFCTNDPYIVCTGSNTFNESSKDEDRPGRNHASPKLHCWRAPKFPLKKAWQLRPQHQRCHLVGWVLPCSTVK